MSAWQQFVEALSLLCFVVGLALMLFCWPVALIFGCLYDWIQPWTFISLAYAVGLGLIVTSAVLVTWVCRR